MSGIPTIESYAMPTRDQLPTNIARWRIDEKRAVLLLHDMQKYFIRCIPEKNLRAELLKNSILIRNYCINKKIPVAYTAQLGNMTTKERGLLEDFWGVGMKADLIDRDVVNELAPRPEDWILAKWRYSAFHSTNLLQKMQDAGRDQLIICGVYAHIGVLVTAVEAFSHDIQTFLIADAVADFSLLYHQMALNYAAQCCAVVMLTHEVTS